ncbi:Biotin/lipoate A/B protein ligase [Tulasnella sp. 424]|nr:Biotin/lipoate A/B protein ligase [Tulasnella sp. 424]KAG8982102.1 Biotin/lipoate A/B protein ligase [Tulasnella sp. 425]
MSVIRSLGMAGQLTSRNFKDLGNTNYSIMVPRTSFQRRPNAELVARAVSSIGPPAEWFTGDHVSGSAYKIVNKRAYHHGTMLIDAKLNQLGDLLHNTKENLITKGVESVRSPVQNLRKWAPNLTHEDFVDAVSQEFQKTYNGSQDIHKIDKDLVDDIPGIRSVYDELQTWDWQYGQTPEFTHRLSGTFNWGDISADVSSKHGRITSVSISHTPPLVSDDPYDDVEDICLKLSTDLVGLKYATLDDIAGPPPHMQERDERIRNQILAWLKEEM